ncbi:hypothetical protein IW147_002435 [Coemansia sp. RSA 720]|nr:hypothetical protein IW147_002435 [Coemansia sp. RSA 720]
MSNTAISEATMRGVLEQLPLMSGKIVDGTRHEKVLSYMRLYLSSDSAVEQLMSWNVLDTLVLCLQPQSDMRVTATAVRFLGDALRAHNGEVLWTAVHATQIVEWIVDNTDSPHALVRVAWLHFMRQASYINDSAFTMLLDRVDYPRLLLRRLLDSSYFVVAEACALLGRLFYANNSIDPKLSALVEQLVARPFHMQTSARKAAVLAAVETLLLLKNSEVQQFVHRVFAQPMEPYLYDNDRLVRDRALDVLELMVLDVDAQGVCELVAVLARRVDMNANVVLRCLAAVVKQLPNNKRVDEGEAQRLGQMIATMGVELLLRIHPAVDGSDVDQIETQITSSDVDIAETQDVESTLITSSDVDRIQSQVAKAAQQSPSAASTIACEAARIVREHSQTSFSAHTASSMCLLLSNPRVQQHTQLVQLVLSTLLQTLRLAHSRTHVQMVPQLISTFAIRAPGLRGVFDLAHELLGSCTTEFVRSLEHAVRTRIVDVEWEARDTVLEFVTRAVREHAWPSVEQLATRQVVDDAVRALTDAEEYVRASAAHLLAAVVERGDEERAWYVSEHSHLTGSDLARLVADSEAFVKRAALDLVHALGTRGTGMWVECLSYRTLYDLADDPDFEVRVRCARVLALLTQNSAADAELQSTSLLLEMCRDSSRYVRAECLRSLRELKQNTQDVDMTNEPEPKRVDVGEQSSLYEKLKKVDLAQLEASLSAEHLYQEALDTQVARELMREQSDANAGNNILDCY